MLVELKKFLKTRAGKITAAVTALGVSAAACGGCRQIVNQWGNPETDLPLDSNDSPVSTPNVTNVVVQTPTSVGVAVPDASLATSTSVPETFPSGCWTAGAIAYYP